MAYIGKRPADTFPATNAITTTTIADNAVTSVKIAENAVTSRELAANTIATSNIADNSIDSTKIAMNSILTRHIDDAQVTTSQLASDSVTTVKILDANVTSAKIANNAILTQHIDDNQITADQLADDAVDTAAILDSNVTTAKLASDSVTTAKITDANVTTAKIADDAVTLAKMAGLSRGSLIYGNSSGNPTVLVAGSNNQILRSDGTDISWGADSVLTTEQVQDIAGGMFSSNTETNITATYEDGDGTIDLVVGTLNQDTTGSAATLTTGRTIGMTGDVVWTSPSFDGSGNVTAAATIQANAVESAMIAENNITTREIAANTIATANIADNAVDGTKIAQNSILTRHIDDGQVTTSQLGADAVTGAKIADDAIDSEHYTAASIDTAHIAASQITNALMADDAIDSAEIADGAIDTAHIADDQVTAAKLANTAVTAASYGSGSAIPVITVDAQGRITAATTAATSSTLTIAADSGSNDTVTVGTDTLTFEGTANEIETTVSNNKINIGLPTNVTIAGNLTVSGTTTEVSSTTINVADPLVSLATSNNSSDAVDIGIYGLYDTSGSQDLYGGLFRDASDSGKWKLFKDTQATPTTTVNTSGTGYATGTLVANIEGNVTGNVTGNTSGSSGSTTGNAATATALATARTIGGTSFDGTANIAVATATEATNVTVSANNSTDETVYPTFVDGATSTQGIETDTGLTYNPSSGTLTSTAFVGGLTGNVTGNASGTAATVTGGTQAAITSAANLVTVGTIGTGVWQGTAIASGYIAADAITGAKIADDAIDSEHYTAASIDTAHIAASQITNALMADDAIDSAEIADGSIDTAHIADDQVTLAKMAGLARGKVIVGDASGNPSALALGTSGYVLKSNGTDIAWAADSGLSTEEVQDIAGGMFSSNTETGITATYQDSDGTVDLVIGTGDIASTMIADDAITQAKINDDAVGADQLAVNSVVSASIVNGSIVSADIAANTIATSNVADNAIDSTKIASNSILTRHIDDNQITGDQLADDLVLSGTGAIRMPDGTTGQRPGSPAAGMFRYNTTLGKFEGYTSGWGEIGGGTSAWSSDTMTGDGSDTTLTLSAAPNSEADVIVFIDGVFQNQDSYNVSGTTLTFDTAPVSGRYVRAYTVKQAISGTNLTHNAYSGDGSDTTFTLSIAPVHENNTQVYIDGVYQHKTTYSISGTTLTFSSAPPDGTTIEVMTMNQLDINVPVDDTITSAKLSGVLTMPNVLTVKSYTVSALPTAVAGGVIFVTNETGGAVLAFSDGTNWRRSTDRAVVS